MRAKWTALGLVVVLAFYLVAVGWRGVLLVLDGRPVAVLLGLAVLVLPVVTGWAVWREVRFGVATQGLGRALDAEGGLVVDDLPRTPGGRVDRAAADAAFDRHRAEVESAPEDWRAWYRLATAYDLAGDRRRARAAARRAVALHRAAASS